MFQKIVDVTPAYDRRHHSPSAGLSDCTIIFVLKGPLGAVYFQAHTGWHLPHVHRDQASRSTSLHAERQIPRTAEVGYHSPTPMYQDQRPSMDPCPYLDGQPCYRSCSVQHGMDLIPQFVAGGTEFLWPKLEEVYHRYFTKEEEPEGMPPVHSFDNWQKCPVVAAQQGKAEGEVLIGDPPTCRVCLQTAQVTGEAARRFGT